MTGLGVVVPVRDEEAHLGSSLRALWISASRISSPQVPTRLVIVLDSCSDRSADVAWAFCRDLATDLSTLSTKIVATDQANVGKARLLGVSHILEATDPLELPGLWLATTDADSTVPPDWLRHQLRARRRGVQGWAGTVVVDDWSLRTSRTRSAFLAHYETARSRHVHGANLAFGAESYIQAGGFPPLVTAEDHGLWRALRATGARLLHDPTCPVQTSARVDARAPAGFAAALDDFGAAGASPAELR